MKTVEAGSQLDLTLLTLQAMFILLAPFISLCLFRLVKVEEVLNLHFALEFLFFQFIKQTEFSNVVSR